VEVVVMPKFRAGAARRFHALIGYLEKRTPGKSTLGDVLIELAGIKHKPIAFDNSDVWALLARSALTLDDKDEMDITPRLAFDALGLDHHDPFGWRILATYFAEVLFGNRRPPGRHVEWTTERYIHLLKLVSDRRTENKALSIKQACIAIAKDKNSPNYFRKATPAALYKAVERARKKLPASLLAGLPIR
jgi:hypothetical protein